MLKLMSRCALMFCAVVVAACGSAAAAHSLAAGVAACSSSGLDFAKSYGSDAHLIASFDVTAAQIAAWQERPRAANAPHITTSTWRSHAVNERVGVCYYDGTFDRFGLRPAPVPGQTPPALKFERLVVLVGSDGQVVFSSIGAAANIAVDDPSKP